VPPASPRLALAACILGSAAVFVDTTVVNVALPSLRDDLDATLAGQQWVVEAYLLLLASFVLAGGALGDVLGRRRVFLWGAAGFGVTSVLCAVAPTVETLVAARALQGLAGALLVPSSLAIITETHHDPVARGAAIGTWTAWTSAAIAVGPPLGGVLVDAVSWRLVFAINVPVIGLAMWLGLRHIPELAPVPGEGRRVDVPGALLAAGGFGGLVLGLIEQPSHGWGHPLVLVPLVGGAVLLAAFLAWERRAPRPMLPPVLFAVRDFSVANAATFAVYAGLGAGTFFVAIFLQQVSGYGATEGGLALMPVTLCLVLLSRRWGALAQRTGPRTLMTLGPLVMAVGLLLFTRLDVESPYVEVVLPAALVFGLGLSMTVAPLTATVLAAVDDRHAGVASGVNNAVARVAGLVAIAGVGAVVAGRLGASTFEQAPAADAVGAFQAGMVVSAVLVGLGGLVSLIGLRPARAAAGAA
jgi:EmrB/QacA subfamily drug resistance transporter